MHIFGRFFKFSLCSLAIFSSHNSFAWWDQAHQMVGAIAEQNVSEDTNEQVLALLNEPITTLGNKKLSANLNAFDTAASWADSLKAHTSQYSECHYLDLILDKNMIGTVVNDSTAQNALNTALANSKLNELTCLKGFIKTLTDPSQSVSDKAIAVRFVIHIVGDMTQPLHNASLVQSNGTKDDGGNKTYFPVSVDIPATDGTSSPQTKLHALWDGTLGAFLQFPYNPAKSKTGTFSQSDLQFNRDASTELQKRKNIQDIRQEITESNQSIEDWIIDGYRIAVQQVYTDLNTSWKFYSANRYDVIDNQIAKGGYRLAFLLNAIFDPSNSPLAFQDMVYSIKNDRLIVPLSSKK